MRVIALSVSAQAAGQTEEVEEIEIVGVIQVVETTPVSKTEVGNEIRLTTSTPKTLRNIPRCFRARCSPTLRHDRLALYSKP